MSDECPDGQILARATIRLNGDPYPVEPGDIVCVDPDDPQMKTLLTGGPGGGYLVAVDDSWQPDRP